MALRSIASASTGRAATRNTSGLSTSLRTASRQTKHAGSVEPPELLPVLKRAWERPFLTRSDFARTNADEVAIASCLGLLTVRHDPETWGRFWRITATGLSLLNIQETPMEIIP